MSGVKCGVCGKIAEFFDSGRIMGKYDISYYRCPACGFVQTEEPYWLDESYSSAIADSDIGLIGRNIQNCRIVSALLKTIIRYGGGIS